MQTDALSLLQCFNSHPAFGGHCNRPSPAEFVMPKEMMFICPKLTCLRVRDRQQHQSVIHSTFPSSPASPKALSVLWKCLKVTVLNATEIFLLLQLLPAPGLCMNCSRQGEEGCCILPGCAGGHPSCHTEGRQTCCPSLPCQAPPDTSPPPLPPPVLHTRAIQVKVQIQSHTAPWPSVPPPQQERHSDSPCLADISW